jgi:hypothetical protein
MVSPGAFEKAKNIIKPKESSPQMMFWPLADEF